jgi:glycosyltransferase involved in cell wall biosynthesis
VRILLDYRSALRQRTGVGEYAHELARALVDTASGHNEELTLFSASWKDRLAADVVPGTTAIDRRVPNRALNLAWHRWEWPPVELVAGAEFDVVQTFHPLLIPTRGAAQVVAIHDLDFLDHPERTAREIRRDYPALAGDHARRAHHVVTISETTAAAIRDRLHVPGHRITVCTPGAPTWVRRDREPANGCLLFLGALEPRKNLGVLLDAYERLRQHLPDAPPLVLAGRAAEAAGEILDRTTRAPLAGHVELPGYVPADAREALYRRALVFVMPSHTEGFGMPVLEAMTMGVPVVVANRGALPEVTGEAGRRFEPDDAAQLAAILTELVSSTSARQSLREAGWQRSRAFSWRESAARLRHAWAAAQIEQRSRRG